MQILVIRQSGCNSIRIPEYFRDVNKEFASLKGMSFSAMIRAGLTQQFVKKDL